MRGEELLAKADRRLVIRLVFVAVCLFFVVSIVGSWHDHLKHNTGITDAIWTIVVTTYKLALVALLLGVLAAMIGAAMRRRQDS